MNYTELVATIKDTVQNSETSFLSHINEFIIDAENKIYSALQGPVFWSASNSVTTTDGTNSYTLTGGTIDVLGIRLCETPGGNISTGGPFRYLLRKDVDFILEAFPGSSSGLEKGIPKYYAVTSASLSSGEPTLSIRLGPAPDGAYATEVEYYGKSSSDSITDGATPSSPTTTTTWVSVAFPEALKYGSILHAYIYMKGEQDVMSYYESKFSESLTLLKNMTESRQMGDTYKRSAEDSAI